MAGVWAMLITGAVLVCVFGTWLFSELPSQSVVARFLFDVTYAPPGQISTANGFAIAIQVVAAIAGLITLY